MNDDFRRRRRLSNPRSPRRRSGPNGMNPWVVTIFAALVVIIGGWFLGQALARVFNGPPKSESAAHAPTPLPIVTPPPSPAPAPTGTATPPSKPKPTAKPTPEPTPQPTLAAPAPATPAATSTPTSTPAPPSATTPSAAPTATAAARVATPTPPAARPPAAQTTPAARNSAERLVDAYIRALRRGDPATASTYLGNGSPDETFIDASTRIASISSSRNSDGSYKVSVDMRTSGGEYYETFTVASGRILEKTAIKP